MITLLHGEDIILSRNALLAIKAQFKGEILYFDGKTVEMDRLKQAVESIPLFADSRLLIIENLFGRPSKTQLKTILSYLNLFQKETTIVFWENKEIKKTSLDKTSTTWNVQLFSFPKILFKFLEAVIPGNSRQLLPLLLDLRRNYDDEFLFLMIVRQFKYLILACNNELSGMPSWMQYQYLRQAKAFTRDYLLSIYKKLLLIDITQKTSSSAFNLACELDLFLGTL